ncbi:MAG: hypothetical protein ACFFB0_15840 [Promethearchaeota archaeon]
MSIYFEPQECEKLYKKKHKMKCFKRAMWQNTDAYITYRLANRRRQ